MPLSSRHYETAFDAYLRRRRAPYVSVRAARRALIGETTRLTCLRAGGMPARGGAFPTLKSFDFVLYGDPVHALIEIKGRRIAAGPEPSAGTERRAGRRRRGRSPRTESWVTLDDIESLRVWLDLFGPGYRGVIVFLYWCQRADDAVTFAEHFTHDGRSYGVRAISLEDYAREMVTRSPRWRTVNVPAVAFEKLSGPLLGQAPMGTGEPGASGVRERVPFIGASPSSTLIPGAAVPPRAGLG